MVLVMNIIESIIPYLYDIAISLGIISVCYALWIQGRYYGENLTMEENPIKITIENYKDQTITFTMPHDIPVSILRGTSSDRFNYLNISVVGGDKYTIEEESTE